MKLRLKEKSHVQLAIRQYLTWVGWTVHRLQSDLRPGIGAHAADREEPGTPDLIAWRPAPPFEDSDQIIYIEVKRPGGKLNRNQEIWIDNARKRGFCVAVVDSLDALRTWMAEEGIA